MRAIAKLRIFEGGMAYASKHFFTDSCCRINTGFAEKIWAQQVNHFAHGMPRYVPTTCARPVVLISYMLFQLSYMHNVYAEIHTLILIQLGIRSLVNKNSIRRYNIYNRRMSLLSINNKYRHHMDSLTCIYNNNIHIRYNCINCYIVC